MSHSPEELVNMGTTIRPQLSLVALEELANTLDLLVVGTLYGHQDHSRLITRLEIRFFRIHDRKLRSRLCKVWNPWRHNFEGRFKDRWRKFHPLHEKVLRVLINLGQIVQDSDKTVEQYLQSLGQRGVTMYFEGNIQGSQASFDQQSDLMKKLGVLYPQFSSRNRQFPPSWNPQRPSGNAQFPPGWNPQFSSGNAQFPITNPQYPIPNPQYPIPNPQYPIPNPQFPIADPQYPIPNPQFPIADSQYPIPNPQFPIADPQFPTADSQFQITDTDLFADLEFPIADPQFSTADSQLQITNPQSPTADPQVET